MYRAYLFLTTSMLETVILNSKSFKAATLRPASVSTFSFDVIYCIVLSTYLYPPCNCYVFVYRNCIAWDCLAGDRIDWIFRGNPSRLDSLLSSESLRVSMFILSFSSPNYADDVNCIISKYIFIDTMLDKEGSGK